MKKENINLDGIKIRYSELTANDFKIINRHCIECSNNNEDRDFVNIYKVNRRLKWKYSDWDYKTISVSQFRLMFNGIQKKLK